MIDAVHRNIDEAGIEDGAFAELLKQLQNPEAIKKSLVMPFRILVAYRPLCPCNPGGFALIRFAL